MMRIAALLLLAYAAAASANAGTVEVQSPAIKRVIGMLNNLVAVLDEESAKDEKTFTHFSSWCTTQISETTSNIATLQAGIEQANAVLSSLRARQADLTMTINGLKEQISTESTQLQMAREKRAEEHESFLHEQQDFDSAISACATATKVLASHYGSGETQAAAKPDFLSLVSKQMDTVRRVAKPYAKAAKLVELLQTAVLAKNHARRAGLSLRQAPGGTINNNRYQASTGEAGNIVDQIGELSETFGMDKEAAVNDENRLQGLFATLQAQKEALLANLRGELATNEGLLTSVNEEIANEEGKLARLERELADDQAYLKRTVQLRDDATEAYNRRQADRASEREAVGQATHVLESFLSSSFVQQGALLKRSASSSAFYPMSVVMAASSGQSQLAALSLSQSLTGSPLACPKCKVAASLLRTRATKFHSDLLQAAASAAEGAGNEAIAEIVQRLAQIVEQLNKEQRSEDEHKGWCDKELGLTNNKITDHSSVIGHLQGVLANLKEVIVEEKEDRDENHEQEVEEDHTFDELTRVRSEEHEDYEHTREETTEAIAALNQAIGILAKFYASRKAASGADLLQANPETGGQVVNMISHTRQEFEVAKKHLETDESNAVKDYGDNKNLHVTVDGNIQTDENYIDINVRNTENALDANTENLGEEKQEKVSAEQYLDQLGKSCYMLINNYDDRKKRRVEERQAIQDASKVLEEHA